MTAPCAGAERGFRKDRDAGGGHHWLRRCDPPSQERTLRPPTGATATTASAVSMSVAAQCLDRQPAPNGSSRHLCIQRRAFSAPFFRRTKRYHIAAFKGTPAMASTCDFYKHGVKLGDLTQPMRLTVTGRAQSAAGLFDLLPLLPWKVIEARLSLLKRCS